MKLNRLLVVVYAVQFLTVNFFDKNSLLNNILVVIKIHFHKRRISLQESSLKWNKFFFISQTLQRIRQGKAQKLGHTSAIPVFPSTPFHTNNNHHPHYHNTRLATPVQDTYYLWKHTSRIDAAALHSLAVSAMTCVQREPKKGGLPENWKNDEDCVWEREFSLSLGVCIFKRDVFLYGGEETTPTTGSVLRLLPSSPCRSDENGNDLLPCFCWGIIWGRWCAAWVAARKEKGRMRKYLRVRESGTFKTYTRKDNEKGEWI